MSEEKVVVRRVYLGETATELLRYTDVIVTDRAGRSYYSRLVGWDVPQDAAYHLRAWHRRRDRPPHDCRTTPSA